MNQAIRTIRLYGKLGTKFGRVHTLAVESTAEAIRALCATLPGFERELMTSKDRGVSYACFIGKRNLGPENIADPVGGQDIRVAPILQGNKKGGLFQTIIGVALIALAITNPMGWVALGVAGAVGTTAVLSMGISLALGGVVQMLSPQQKGLSAKDKPENGASYNFNGPVNTSAQGNPVPVLYGELIIGSSVISAGIESHDRSYIADPKMTSTVTHEIPRGNLS